MKKALATIITLVVSTLVGFLAVNHYYDYKQSQSVEERAIYQSIENTLTQQIREGDAKLNAAIAERDRLYNECKKGEETYAKLTEFQKAQTQAPACGGPTAEPVVEATPAENTIQPSQ